MSKKKKVEKFNIHQSGDVQEIKRLIDKTSDELYAEVGRALVAREPFKGLQPGNLYVQHFYSAKLGFAPTGDSALCVRHELIGTVALEYDDDQNVIVIGVAEVFPKDKGKARKKDGFDRATARVLRTLERGSDNPTHNQYIIEADATRKRLSDPTNYMPDVVRDILNYVAHKNGKPQKYDAWLTGKELNAAVEKAKKANAILSS